MKIKCIDNNMTELDLGWNGYEETKVLFSYETPVAYKKLGPCGVEHYRTGNYYSKTTNKHLKKWCHKYDGLVDQTYLDNLVK